MPRCEETDVLSFELKVNHRVVGTVEASRVLGSERDGTVEYWAKVRHEMPNEVRGKTTLVRHNPDDGAFELVRKVLDVWCAPSA